MQIIITAIIVLIAFWVLYKKLKSSLTVDKGCNCSASSCDGCPMMNKSMDYYNKK